MSAKPENASRASMHEVNTLGVAFADVHAAMQWVSNCHRAGVERLANVHRAMQQPTANDDLPVAA